MKKPSLNDLVNNYERVILELRNGERAVVVKVWDTFHNRLVLKVVELYEAKNNNDDYFVDTLLSLYDEDERNEFFITKMYVAKDERDYLYYVLNENKQPNWDWKEEDAQEMTLSEVCKALGKNIKIIKE